MKTYRSLRAWLTAGLRAAMLLAIVSSMASAQTPQPATPPAGESAAPAKPPENSGLLGEIGKLLTAPAALLPSLKPADPEPSPTPSPTPAPSPAPAETPVNSPGSRLMPGIVSGRELCPRSDNGAPDCKAGSDKLCRDQGYTEGKSLTTDSVFGCSTKSLRARGKPCGTQNYVTRALCQ